MIIALAGVLFLAFYMVIQAERAIKDPVNNPLRGLIALDEQAAWGRTSIIVG
jgi:hypothetical protein